MTVRIENNYQLLDIGGWTFAVESFDNRTFDILDSETSAWIGAVTASTDDDLLDRVTALVSGMDWRETVSTKRCTNRSQACGLAKPLAL